MSEQLGELDLRGPLKVIERGKAKFSEGMPSFHVFGALNMVNFLAIFRDMEFRPTPSVLRNLAAAMFPVPGSRER